MKIDQTLVHKLISQQFSQWSSLTLSQIKPGGWDNRTFRLGDTMAVRLPSDACYAENIVKECNWLPTLSSQLSFKIPQLIGEGRQSSYFPYPWAIYQWIDGKTLSNAGEINKNQLATDLAQFLQELQFVTTQNAPPAGEHNFYRGYKLAYYDGQTKEAIKILSNKIDTKTAAAIWDQAAQTCWTKNPIWIHGDVSQGNLLINNGRLDAVIDFGCMAVGDPACDYVMAWTYFDDESRDIFKKFLNIDEATWLRSKAWALWKALIIASGLVSSNESEPRQSWPTIQKILNDVG